MDSTPTQATEGDASLDDSWDTIRKRLVTLLGSLEGLQTLADDKLKAGKITVIEYGRLLDLEAKILIIVPRVKKSIEAADLRATETNLGALTEVALEFMRESGAG